jgi:alkanesulfonate monooxygenase SsuD/methylene tetrahydromethanopterin reductase-like flavin-dependent oxidoreductase (luciferase family)
VRVHQRPEQAATRAQVDKVRAAAQAAGATRGIKVFMGINVIVGATEDEAACTPSTCTTPAPSGVAHFAAPPASISRATAGRADQYVKGNAIQSATRQLQNNAWTRRRLLEQHALGGRYITLVGTQGGRELIAGSTKPAWTAST